MVRRIKIVGMALVAVFAAFAVGVSTASAMIENAEFSKEGTNNGFTGKNRAGLEPTLDSVAGTIKCKSDTSKGRISGGAGSVGIEKVVITYKECKGKYTEECAVKSTGAATEEIKTAELRGTLARILSKEATSEVGLVFAGPGGVFVTLEGTCLPVTPTKVTGKLAGEMTPTNKSQSKGELIFRVLKPETLEAEQQIKKACLLVSENTFGGLPCNGGSIGLDKMELTLFAAEEGFEMTAEELTFEEAFELNSDLVATMVKSANPFQLKDKGKGLVKYENIEIPLIGKDWYPGKPRLVFGNKGFKIKGTNTCTGKKIAPKKGCEIEVEFTGAVGEKDELKLFPAEDVGLESIA